MVIQVHPKGLLAGTFDISEDQIVPGDERQGKLHYVLFIEEVYYVSLS